MTPEQRQRNLKACADILGLLSSPDLPPLTDDQRARLQHELDDLRWERQRSLPLKEPTNA